MLGSASFFLLVIFLGSLFALSSKTDSGEQIITITVELRFGRVQTDRQMPPHTYFRSASPSPRRKLTFLVNIKGREEKGGGGKKIGAKGRADRRREASNQYWKMNWSVLLGINSTHVIETFESLAVKYPLSKNTTSPATHLRNISPALKFSY